MKGLLQKLLRIQTLKLVLVNPNNVRMDILLEALRDIPTRVVISQAVEDVKVIDTGIFVKKK